MQNYISSDTLFFLCGLQSVVLVLYMLVLGRKLDGMHTQRSLPNREEMKKHILWYSFYINPDDPRGWVPKTYGIGYTVNFRNKKNALIFSLMVINCLALALLAT